MINLVQASETARKSKRMGGQTSLYILLKESFLPAKSSSHAGDDRSDA